MGGPGSGRPKGDIPKPKPLPPPPKEMIKEGSIELPADASPEEIYVLGLRVFKWLLPLNLDADFRLDVLTSALKWVSTEPVKLSDQDKAKLEAVIAEVVGIGEGKVAAGGSPAPAPDSSV